MFFNNIGFLGACVKAGVAKPVLAAATIAPAPVIKERRDMAVVRR